MLTEAHLSIYFQDLETGVLCQDVRRYKDNTLAKYTGAAKAWMLHLKTHNLIFLNPLEDYKVAWPQKNKYKPTLTESQVQQLLALPDLATPWSLRNQAALEMAYGSGMRVGEIASLTLSCVDLSKRIVHIKAPKNGCSRLVPLTRTCVDSVERYLRYGRPNLRGYRTESALWLGRRERIATASTFGSAARIYSQRLPFSYTFHSLRHACATHLLQAGASAPQIAVLLGHESLESTTLYTKVRFKELQQVHKRTHPRAIISTKQRV